MNAVGAAGKYGNPALGGAGTSPSQITRPGSAAAKVAAKAVELGAGAAVAAATGSSPALALSKAGTQALADAARTGYQETSAAVRGAGRSATSAYEDERPFQLPRSGAEIAAAARSRGEVAPYRCATAAAFGFSRCL